MDVFVSYSGKDTEFVKKMCGVLKSHGITYWAAYENENMGESSVEKVLKYISDSKVLLVFVSKSSNESKHVMNEINCASMYKKQILPVVIDDVEISPVFGYYIANSNRLSYSQSGDFIETFVDMLRSMIGGNALPEDKKAVKQTSLKDKKGSKGKKITIGITAVIVAAAIVTGVVLYPKLSRHKQAPDTNASVTETLANEQYSDVEFGYYYNSIHSSVYNESMQYENYGAGMGVMYTGFDCTKLPEDQEYRGSDYTLPDGATPTWKQYFEYVAFEQLKMVHILEDLAAKDGFVVDPAVLAEAEASIEEMKLQLSETANHEDITPQQFSTWLSETYGEGMNENILKEIIKRQTIASEYATFASKKYIDDALADNARLEEEYKKDPSLYNCVDFRIFTITPETSENATTATQEQKDAAKKKADEMFGKITDEESFKKLAAEYATAEQKEASDYTKDETTLMKYVDKVTYEASFGAEAIKWLFGAETKANEKKMFENNGTYYLFYMIKASYRDDAIIPVDVRHILYQFDDAAADKEAKKASAEATLNAINKAGDKLATFLTFCEKDSADTGSASNGGLIEYLGRGKYVKAFEEWSLDPNRKVGDVGVIETEYGYHVMYFEKKHEAPMWKITIASQIASEEFTKKIEDLAASDAYKADPLYITELSEKLYQEVVKTYYAGI